MTLETVRFFEIGFISSGFIAAFIAYYLAIKYQQKLFKAEEEKLRFNNRMMRAVLEEAINERQEYRRQLQQLQGDKKTVIEKPLIKDTIVKKKRCISLDN